MKCSRCGGEYERPEPEVVNPNGIREIATSGYCPACNKVVMSVVYRDRSAYWDGTLIDPVRLGIESEVQ